MENSSQNMGYKYTVLELPPSNNRFIGRTNFREYQRVKRHWEDMIFLFCRPAPEKPLENVTVKLTYFFPDRKRRDPDNYSGKMLLDGLTKAGIIADDCFSNITLELCGEYDKANPRTEIEIERIVS